MKEKEAGKRVKIVYGTDGLGAGDRPYLMRGRISDRGVRRDARRGSRRAAVRRSSLDERRLTRLNGAMPASDHVRVKVDLSRVAENAREIAGRCAVPIIAVVKADAYGLGAADIVTALADIVEGFCVFGVHEAAAAQIYLRSQKETICLGPDPRATLDDYLALHARPAVWTVERAAALRAARPVLSVDTGMQRFACPASALEAVRRAGDCHEAMTHAVRVEQVDQLVALVGRTGMKLHAAGSALLDEPTARLNAVRPGMALYQGAAHVSTPLVEVRQTRGAAGYTGFAAGAHGVILAGYYNGLRSGPCVMNGRRSRIVEVGMQSAYVLCQASDRIGDDVVLLGEGLNEKEVADEWKCSPQAALTTLAGMGRRLSASDA